MLYGLFWNTVPITLIGMPFSRAISSGPIGRSPSCELSAGDVADRIDVGAARHEGRLDAVFLEAAVLDAGEVAAVLDALDP